MRNNKKVKTRIPEDEAILDQLEFTMEDYSDACKKLKGEYQRFIKFIFNELGLEDNAKVLEIGPGPGWIGIIMVQQNPNLNVIGLEISEDMIRVANKNKKEEGVENNISYIHGDAKNMREFENKSFDAIISNGSLHHWGDPIKVFNEIARLIKYNSVFCICDGRRDISIGAKAIFHIIKYFIPKFMRIGWKNSRMAGYTPEDLEDLLPKLELRNKYEIKTNLFDLMIYNKLNSI